MIMLLLVFVGGFGWLVWCLVGRFPRLWLFALGVGCVNSVD